MRGSNLDSKGYIKEINRLERNLGARAKNIERRGELAFQYLPEKLKKVKAEHPKSLEDMELDELRSYYRELADIDRRKTSTLKGAIKLNEEIGDVTYQLPEMTEEQKAIVFRLFGKAYELNAEIGTTFKYELLDVAADISEIYSKKSSEFLFDEILSEFEKLEKRQAELEKQRIEEIEQKGKSKINVDKELGKDFFQVIERFRQFYL